jgi:hypothetical protein
MRLALLRQGFFLVAASPVWLPNSIAVPGRMEPTRHQHLSAVIPAKADPVTPGAAEYWIPRFRGE